MPYVLDELDLHSVIFAKANNKEEAIMKQTFRAIYEYENGEIFYDPGDESDSLLEFPDKGDDFRVPGEKMIVVMRGTLRFIPKGKGQVTIVPVVCKSFEKSSAPSPA
jgi:hypothetical protein